MTSSKLTFWLQFRNGAGLFLELDGLAGLRVEDPAIFAGSHRLILDLVQSGTVDGVSICHIDGLIDPQAYLACLRTAVGSKVYIAVHNNRPEAHETSTADPPADEANAESLVSVLRPPGREEHPGDHAEEVRAIKRQLLCHDLESDTRRLAALAKGMADRTEADLSRSTVTEAIRAIIVALPVYRTYSTADGISERDWQILAQARQSAQEDVRPEVREGIDFIWELLVDERIAEKLPDCAEFRRRFQQLSGLIMAKTMEALFEIIDCAPWTVPPCSLPAIGKFG